MTVSFDKDCSYFGGWGSFYYLFTSGFMIIIGFIIIIIGFIIKLRLKKKTKYTISNTTKSCKIKIFCITNIIMILLLLLALVIPYQINLHNFKKFHDYSKYYLYNYLDNKYGKNNYKTISFERDYSYNGIISKSFIGFKATIHLDNMKDFFNVYVHRKNKNELIIMDEIVQRENLNLSPLN